jgi:hypothetical protein
MMEEGSNEYRRRTGLRVMDRADKRWSRNSTTTRRKSDEL